MELKKEWIRITNTLIREFEEKRKYLFIFESNKQIDLFYCSEPSWIYNKLEQNNYDSTINIKLLKNNNGKYDLIREYKYDHLNKTIVCFMI